jgi:hypothetical protein
MTPLDEDGLGTIVQGHCAFQLLYAGSELELFELLAAEADGLTLDEIAGRLGLERYPARVLCAGLGALGVLEVSDGRYRNARVVTDRLLKDSPNSLRPMLAWQQHLVYKGMWHFTDSLREGRNLGLREFPGEGDMIYLRLNHDPQLLEIFQAGMSALSSGANDALADVAPFEYVQHLCDIGGGAGTNAIKLVQRHPHLKVTIFDVAPVCEMAKANIEQHGLSDRISTHAGDVFNDPLPPDIDGAMLSHMAQIWSPEINREVIGKVGGAIPAGGHIYLVGLIPEDDETEPVTAVLPSTYFLGVASGRGMTYPWKDYAEWLGEVGFQVVDQRRLPLFHGVVVARKGA